MAGSWELLDHVCRLCHGRLLLREDAEGQARVRCADCDTEVIGSVRDLCVCGARTPNGRYLLGLRCVVNPAHSAASPQRVVVMKCQD